MRYLLPLLILFCATTQTNAGVRSITDSAPSNRASSGIQFMSSAQHCFTSGYEARCPAGYIGIDRCPYDSRYYRDCCQEPYTHLASECLAQGLTPSEATCLGYHACE